MTYELRLRNRTTGWVGPVVTPEPLRSTKEALDVAMQVYWMMMRDPEHRELGFFYTVGCFNNKGEFFGEFPPIELPEDEELDLVARLDATAREHGFSPEDIFTTLEAN